MYELGDFRGFEGVRGFFNVGCHHVPNAFGIDFGSYGVTSRGRYQEPPLLANAVSDAVGRQHHPLLWFHQPCHAFSGQASFARRETYGSYGNENCWHDNQLQQESGLNSPKQTRLELNLNSTVCLPGGADTTSRTNEKTVLSFMGERTYLLLRPTFASFCSPCVLPRHDLLLELGFCSCSISTK
eukprot:2428646-Amphidinium_carterae.1